MRERDSSKMLLLPLAICSCMIVTSQPVFAEQGPAKNMVENNKEDAADKNAEKPTVNDLKAFYSQGKYKEILTCVRSMQPTAMTHYYTGLAYQNMNQHYRAALEYNYVSKFAKDKTLKDNATRALKSLYKVKRSKKASVDQFGNETEFARIPENHYPGGPAPADALERIRRETRRQERTFHPNRDRYGNWHHNRQK